jgi:hypothetical protein
MSTVTDAEVEAGLRELSKRMSYALGISWDLWAPRARPELTIAMRAALEAAEAVRVKAESNLQKVQIPTSTIPEGFIPWHGGERPVAEGTVVSVRLRSQVTSHESAAKSLRWDHLNEDDTRIITDIIAYRIHKPENFRLEAGKFYVTASGERVGPMVETDRRYGSGFSVGDTRLWDHYGKLVTGTGSLDHLSDILALSSNQENSHD